MSLWKQLTSNFAGLFGFEPAGSGPVRALAEPVRELERGQQVGEYAIERKLGEGGFGGVYAAVHPVIGKKAAVKVLHHQYSANPEMTSRFVAEARAVNQIRHRNIIDIFSFGVLPDGRHYYVMELLEGVALDVWLDRIGRLEPAEAFPLLHAIARALDAAHAAGIAHRDLKPENVFLEVNAEGTVSPKLLDFGVAKLLDPSRSQREHKTQTGSPIGSPRYMSPEQCQGAHVDHRADVYAFGILAHRMLTGSLPFDASTALELMMMHVGADPPPLSSVVPQLSSALDEAVLRMLEKSPDKRPASVSDAFDAMVSAAGNAGLDVQAWISTELTASESLRQLVESQRAPLDDAPAASLRDPGLPWQGAAPANTATTAPQRSRAVLLVSVAAIAAVGVGVGVTQRNRPGAGSALVTGKLAARSVPLHLPVTPASASDRPGGETVQVTLRATPSDAEVFLGETRLGVASQPISLPRVEKTLELTLKAPGYAPLIVAIRPAQGMVVKATLKPTPRTGPSPMPTDLEYPY